MPTVYSQGLRFNYEEAGDGLPIVFVPSFSGSDHWFRYQLSSLSDRYRIISVNLRRAGRRPRYTLELLLQDLAVFMGCLRVREAVIAGHGFGALVAAQFAVQYRQKCLGLVLSGAAPSFSAFSEEDILTHFAPGEIKFEGFFARLWRSLTGGKPQTDEDTGPLAYLAQHRAGLDHATLQARLKIMHRADLAPILADIGVPSLIIAGARDHEAILAGSQILECEIPGSMLEVIEDADHFCFYTRHDIYNQIIHDCIGRTVTRP